MKLITEANFSDFEVLTEAQESGKKNYYISGIFMQGNIKNRNGRVYPTSILEKEMERYTKEQINERTALGELGHPVGPKINEDRASHLIVEMKKDGDNFIGKAKVLGTPMGNILKNFIDEGVKFGVSTRGLGSVKRNRSGINEVQDDFWLATVDAVTSPSGPDCFVNGIYENVDFYFDATDKSWRSAQAIEEIVEEIKSPKKIDNAAAIRLFEKFLDTL